MFAVRAFAKAVKTELASDNSVSPLLDFLLRNCWLCLWARGQFETQGGGVFLQVVKQSVTVFLFIGLQALLDVKVSVFEQTINDPG